jgi:hypothetical protein
MPTERQLLQRFTKQVKKLPDVYWHKIGDTFGGHKKPFDAFAFYNGVGFAFEAKKGKSDKLMPHQVKELTDACMKGAAYTFVMYFHDNDIVFCPFLDGHILDGFSVHLTWHKGEYVNIEYLFFVLIKKMSEAASFLLHEKKPGAVN